MQAAREAARRAQCTNNLKQIGLALHNYETPAAAPVRRPGVREQLGPRPGRVGRPGSYNYRHSALAFVLPFVEQGSMYDGLNFEAAANSVRNRTSYSIRDSSAYVCPSDSAAAPQLPSGFSVGYTRDRTPRTGDDGAVFLQL